jgi:hypothetical protein
VISFFQIADHAIDDGGKLRQAFGYHAPEYCGFDALIFVAQDVADAADRMPLDLGVIRRQFRRRALAASAMMRMARSVVLTIA